MKNTLSNVIDSVLIVLGLSVGLETIESVLGIIILCIQIIWILSKLGIKIYKHIKDGNIEELDDDLKDGIDELKDFKDSIKKGDE